MEKWKWAERKFKKYFSKEFLDPKYYQWERNYKYKAHQKWNELLNKQTFEEFLQNKKFQEISNRVLKIEAGTNLLFSFEKMALRDALKTSEGAEKFAKGLFNLVYSNQSIKNRILEFIEVIRELPRIQTRVFTWPVVTVFGFIANPAKFIYLKPMVTKNAAKKIGYEFFYKSEPNWETYLSLCEFAEKIKNKLSSKPKDFIDLQSFIWVIGSEEYPD